MKKNNVITILSSLDKAYPDARCPLDYKNPYQLFIATVLSARTTDAQVNKATPAFFKKFPDFASLSVLKPEDIYEYIKSIGVFRNKAKSIIESSKIVMSKYRGELPRNIDEMIELPGVGRKTAAIVLGNAFAVVQGIGVDTHVLRISQRLGWSDSDKQDKVESDLMNLIPKDWWVKINHIIVLHGRKICKARNPLCSQCPVRVYCPSAQV